MDNLSEKISEKTNRLSKKASEKELHFPGQDRDEKINLFLRRHPLSFAGFALTVLGMIVLPFLIGGMAIASNAIILEGPLDNKIIVVAASAYLLFCLGLFLIGWMNYYLDVYIITDRRVIDIDQEGLFTRSISSIDLIDVEDVKASVDGFLETYFNYGNVFVQTAGEIQNIDFKYVPSPYNLSREVMDYHEEAVREMGEEAKKKPAVHQAKKEEFRGPDIEEFKKFEKKAQKKRASNKSKEDQESERQPSQSSDEKLEKKEEVLEARDVPPATSKQKMKSKKIKEVKEIPEDIGKQSNGNKQKKEDDQKDKDKKLDKDQLEEGGKVDLGQ